MPGSNQSEIEKKTKNQRLKEIEDKTNNTILVAEDESVNRELILDLLKEAGFHSILLAVNGEEAVDMALKHSPDLILMDIRMPVMDGNTAIARLKQNGYRGPIIILSALTLEEDINKCLQAGAVGHIPKPIDFTQFFSQMGKFLKVKGDKIKSKEVVREPGDQYRIKSESARGHGYKIDDGVSEKVRNIFLSDAREKLSLIKEILETGKFENKRDMIERIAHAYKGNALFLGLSLLEASAQELDQAFKDNAPIPDLINRVMKLTAILKGIIEENTTSSRFVVT